MTPHTFPGADTKAHKKRPRCASLCLLAGDGGTR
jgi:hypothetical protein